VALVVPRMAHLSVDAFLSQLVASINAECHRHGLALLIESTEDEGREPGGFLRLVRGRRIDGLIVANLRTAEMAHLQQLRASGVPLVVFGCQLPDAEGFHTMGDDTWRSARLAVDHLLDLGHRQVAFVNYAQPEFHNVNQRERGWRAALQARGIEPDAAWLAHADISAESGYLATRRLLARGVPFTALFAGNDTIAFGALRALREAGRRVPQDVAVVGYDDIPLAPYADPPLSSVRTDPAAHGRQAVQTLLAQLRPGTGVVDAVPAPVLVVRASCGAAPQR
jgi:LacI family transcriptional regulator